MEYRLVKEAMECLKEEYFALYFDNSAADNTALAANIHQHQEKLESIIRGRREAVLASESPRSFKKGKENVEQIRWEVARDNNQCGIMLSERLGNPRTINSSGDTFPFLWRVPLIKKVVSLMKAYKFLFVEGPEGCGKTTLQRMIAASGGSVCVYVSCKKPFSQESFLNGHIFGSLFTGDLDTMPTPELHRLWDMKKHCIVMLDDAEALHHDDSFFFDLVSLTAMIDFPYSTNFVIAGTHFPDRRLFLTQTVASLGLDSLLLTDSEARDLLSSPLGVPVEIDNDSIASIVVNQCKGHAGSLMLSCKALKEFLEPGPYFLQEPKLIRDYLTRSYTNGLFGKFHFSGPISEFLLKCMVNGGEEKPVEMKQKIIDDMVHSGLLKDVQGKYEFFSPMAATFFIRNSSINRSKKSSQGLMQLSLKIVDRLCRHIHSTKRFPTSQSIQEIFLRILFMITPRDWVIIPQPSGLLGRCEDKIHFYIGGHRSWGVEVCLNGDGLHRESPFLSKEGCIELAVDDLMVFDLRDSGDVLSKANLTTIYPSPDFNTCTLFYGRTERCIQLRSK